MRATRDTNGTARALRAEFDLELSNEVLISLPFNSDNKYSGASFRGGKTFIIGAPEFMPIENKTGIIKRCEEFTKEPACGCLGHWRRRREFAWLSS